jgi:FkbM family methyltransferase
MKLPTFIRYRKYFKNYFNVIFHVVLNRYPVNVTLHSGNEIIAYNYGFVRVASSGLVYSYDRANDLLQFNFSGKDLAFYGSFFNNDFADTFGFQTYSNLNVRDRVVIDVGANIGDSPVYFAIKCASTVYALEPMPYAYKLLKRNIEINNMGNSIIPMDCGTGKTDTKIYIEDRQIDVTGIKVGGDAKGTSVNIMTFKTLLESLDVADKVVVLKMDCEGCEFDSILNTDDNTLGKFKEIVMEYHDKPFSIIKKLHDNGFNIIVDNFNVKNLDGIPEKILKSHIGYLYAFK